MDLFFRKTGKGKTLVILHGVFGMSDNWATIGKALGEHFTVYMVDQRNHGRSGHSASMNYEAMSDDLLGFLEKENLEKPNLLGHSMGGKTIMQFAFDYPEKVEKMIVADISPGASNHNHHHQKLIDALLSIDLEKYSSRNEVSQVLREKTGNARIRQFLLKNLYWKDRSSLGWRVNLEVIRDSLPEIFREVNGLQPFEGPTLFLKGEKSDYITREDIPEIEALFPNSQIREIKKGTHWLHADNPGDFIKEVKNFLLS